jgi:peptide-methionine (R)-S-oxide reductase
MGQFLEEIAMTTRRSILLAGAAIVGATAIGVTAALARKGEFEVTKTPEEWKAILTKQEYYVLREEGTERAFTSPLDKNYEDGMYHCAGCDQAVYSSETKYDSGTGWPSFWAPVNEDVVGTSTDYKLLYPRTEVHCASCGGHLGHVFNDGPKPTGKRHCLNGVALTFKPAEDTTG